LNARPTATVIGAAKYACRHAELLKYLDDFDKQMVNRRSSASGLE
jgi:hypothetical protein